MSKAANIRIEAKARIVAAGFATTVIRGRRDFNADELPAVCIYPEARTVRAESGARYAVDAKLAIEYHKATPALTGDHDDDSDAVDDQAEAMIAAVRAAMEINPRKFGTTPTDALLTHPGLSYESDEISYPDEAVGSVAVRVVYSVPHVENHG